MFSLLFNLVLAIRTTLTCFFFYFFSLFLAIFLAILLLIEKTKVRLVLVIPTGVLIIITLAIEAIQNTTNC